MTGSILNLEEFLYYYRAYVFEVTDGDTIKVNWDLGRRTVAPKEILRFARINAAELRTDLGPAARDYVAARILNKTIIIKTEKDKDSLDAYGGFNRFLAEVYYFTGEGWSNLNNELLQNGLAIPYK